MPELKNALLASFFHPASSLHCNFHTYCPATTDSWCQYQRDIVNKTNLYKPGKGFDPEVIKHVKVEYMKLTDEKELAKCMHGKTQNANESFNSLIWERAPKSRYCGLSKLKLCVYDAVSHFNYGGQCVLDTLKLLNVANPGIYTTNMVRDMNMTRKYNAGYKAKASSKVKRKIIRGLKKKKADKNQKKEGTTYEPGGF